MPELDPIIHAPNRLRICAMLATSAELDFRLLKEQLDVSDSVLSKQLKALEDANYIEAKKRSYNGRPRTWVSLTELGQSAFNNHVAALKSIINSD
ncbi:transcriptional regulator [Pseudoalteromonas luteoviolacea]|uniref:transcriptional regulator n=1 Tax=Pseudoalteromonas luteoviolacea TaxID=43657 RepID=UPI0011521C81|nr:transcriptional regulator [Pseudoalteromonas luteoviolacea]TQF70163.1 helix-turn-helix domain-containing protein [Pseudoalteromonas luteoviolacea]